MALSIALNSLYLVSYTIPIWVLVGLALGGPFWLLAPANIALIHPLFDTLFQTSPWGRRLSELRNRVAGRSRVAEFALLAYPLVQGGVMLLLFFKSTELSLSGYEFWAMALAFGSMSGALGLSAAHELIHRRNRMERALGIALLGMSSYPHFYTEHLYGHHRFVATPRDADTARVGETFYGFLLRSMVQGLTSAYALRPREVRALWAGQLAFYGVVTALFGLNGAMFLLASSFVAVLVIETANYVEHYGLTRRELSPGRYETVTPDHSWDSHHVLTNTSLFNLGLHSDHHSRPLAGYSSLTARGDTNVLPYGFSVMLIIAWIPPLWFKVMNPLSAERAA
jgi:alkane 1-monooxygenase